MDNLWISISNNFMLPPCSHDKVSYNTDMNTTTTTVRNRAYYAAENAILNCRATMNFRSLAECATPDIRAAAATWYAEAGTFARDLPRHDWSFETACAVVAAFSPRIRWDQNKRKAFQYAHGIMPKGLRSHIVAADRCVAKGGFDGLDGLKTNAFARAIAGDQNAVVIDIWMCRAAGLGKDSLTTGQYRAISDAVRTVAREHNMAPAVMQALIWIVVRGKAQ